jgi:hypothetical protein
MLLKRGFFPGFIILCLILITASAILSAAPVSGSTSDIQVMEGPTAYILLGPQTNQPRHILAPQNLRDPNLVTAPTANIQVNYMGSWDTAARAAFEYAVSVWESQLASSVTILVDAQWTTYSDPRILGSAGPTCWYMNFPGTGVISDTWYPAALADRLAGTNLVDCASGIDISAAFNSAYPDWYFGTDGNTPLDQIDFASVVLHELGHGLGFIGSMNGNNSSDTATWGYNGDPYIYDRFAESGAGVSLINESILPSVLYDYLTTDVYFDGLYANQANGGGRVKLFTPSEWMPGSSYSHLDEVTFNPTTSSLMTYMISDGEVIHHPGPVTLGMFRDMGWGLLNPVIPTATPSPTPTPTPIINPVTSYYMPEALNAAAFPGITGQVLYNGVPVGGIQVTLRKHDASLNTWNDAAFYTTHSDGRFFFKEMPALDSGDIYYVYYKNESLTTGRLWFWATRYITSYVYGSAVNLGTFDIADVRLDSPFNGTVDALPTTFAWTRRAAVPSDSYAFHLYDYTDSIPEFISASLGYTNSYTLNTLPTSFYPNTTYHWDLYVIPPGGGLFTLGWGWSLGLRQITFTTSALTTNDAQPFLLSESGFPIDPAMFTRPGE